jgi:hypothetical protein
VRPNNNKGAGFILQSSLCHEGWKFPSVVLTSIDEHYMAEVEVKVKLGHESAHSLLYGALGDFPVPAIMSNVSLIRAVLDVVGGSHSHEVGSKGQGLDSIAALGWLERLLVSGVAAFETYLEGSLCSYTEAESNIIIGDDDEPQAGLAKNVTSAIAALRFPSVSNVEQRKGLSISGLAFACTAATMPLLTTPNADLFKACMSLLKVAMPLLKEPTELSDKKTRCEVQRIQHLFNRLDGLLDAERDYTNSLVDIAADLREGVADFTANKCMGMYFLLAKLVAMIPEGTLYPEGTTVAKSQQTKILLCPTTVAAIRELCAHSKTIAPLFASEAEIKAAWTAFKALNVAAHDSTARAQDLVMCAKSMQHASYSDPVDSLLEKISSTIQVLETATAEEDPEDYGCIEYAVGLYLAMAASGSDSRDVQYQQAQALVTRILTHSVPAFRISCMQQLQALTEGYLPEWTCELFVNFGVTGDKLLPIEIQQMLLQPWLVEAVLMGSVYASNLDTARLDNAQRAALDEPALELLGTLLIALGEAHTSRVFQVAPAAWSRVLVPITLIEWGIAGRELDYVPKSIYAFRNLLEMFCYSSESGTVAKNAYYMLSVFGLFHSNESVRKRSTTLLGSQDDYNWDAKTEFSPWRYLAAEQRSRERYAGRGGDGYHSGIDVRKIARLAFTSGGSGGRIASTNLAAVRQLRSICTDLSITAVDEPEWCVEIAAGAMDKITTFYYQVRDNEIVGSYTSEELTMCLESLLIVRTLGSKSSKVRCDVDMKLMSIDSDIPFSLLLDLSSIPEGDAEHNDLVATIQLLCKQVLALFAVHKLPTHGLCDAGLAASAETRNLSFSSLQVCGDLAATLSFPEFEDGPTVAGEHTGHVSAKDAMDGLVFIDMCPVRYEQGSYAGAGAVAVEGCDLKRVKASASLPPIDTLLNEISDGVSAVIAATEDSAGFEASLDAAQCLLVTVPMVGPFLARKDLDMVLRRAATGHPHHHPSELRTLGKSASFFTAVLKATYTLIGAQEGVEGADTTATTGPEAVKDMILREVRERGDGGELGYLCDCAAACVKDSFPLLASESNSPVDDSLNSGLDFRNLKGTVRSSSRAKQTTPAFASFRGVSQLRLVTLYHTLMSFAGSTAAARGLATNRSVTEAIQSLAFDKIQDPWVRSVALEALQKTFTSASFAPDSLEKGRWTALLDTARVLRKPDSFQGHCILISSMRAIVAGLASGSLDVNAFCNGNESTEPKWLARLLYDRRAEVRLAALECVSMIPTFRHSRALGEVLVALAADSNECAAVCHCALKILLIATFGETRSQIIGQFLCTAEESLLASNPTVSVNAIAMSMSALFKLLTNQASKASTLAIVESLNLMPLLMKICSNTFQEQVTKLAHGRLGVTVSGSSASQGWVDALQQSTGVKGRLAFAACRLSGFRVLQFLETETPAAFRECATRVKFADSLVAAMLTPTFANIEVPPSATGKAQWLALNEGETRCFAAMCDITACTLMHIEEKSVVIRHSSHLLEALQHGLQAQSGRVGVVVASKSPAARSAYLRATLTPVLRLSCLAVDAAPNHVDSAGFTAAAVCARGVVVEQATESGRTKIGEFSRINGQVGLLLSLLLQNSRATLEPELLQEYFIGVYKSVEALQQALEADAKKGSNLNHTTGNYKTSNKVDTTAMRRIIYTLWSSMLVVKSSFHAHGRIAHGLAASSRLHESIDVLLTKCVALTEMNGVHGGRILMAMLQDQPSTDACWTPTFSQVCTASLAVWCSLCANSNESKSLVLKGHTLAAGSDSRYKSTNLAHATVLGTSRAVGPGVNQLALAMVSSAMSCAFLSNTNAEKKSAPIISRIAAQASVSALAESLAVVLKQGEREDVSGTIVHLIDAIGSCVALEGIQCEKRSKTGMSPGGGRSSSPSPTAGGARSPFADSVKQPAATVPCETILDPSLLAHIMKEYRSNSRVANAVVRFLGKQATTKMFVLDGCADLLPNRLMSKANSTESMAILTDRKVVGAHPVNAQLTSVVLWTLVHGSESARANFKQNNPGGSVENYLNGATERAHFGLRNLLA